ncbi:Lysophosphatidic acid:oleoyl-CoA acyltransferase 1, partial [Cryomyces antarcticus]
PTHCIRVRIAERTYNASTPASTSTSSSPSSLSPACSSAVRLPTLPPNSYATNFLDVLQAAEELSASSGSDASGVEGLGAPEKKVLDRIGEALARLGRVKRVALGVREKANFVEAWGRKRK